MPLGPISEERFWARVAKRGPDECWLWTKWCDPKLGYGRYRNKCTHRLAYEFTFGPIPEGMEIDHTCFVTGCCNPAHLRLATGKQNKENRKGGHGKSGIRGVRFKSGRYEERVVHNHQYLYLGRFDTAEEAGEVARLKRLEVFTHNDVDRMVG